MSLKSFRPVIDERSRVLILGTMPGPEALRRREYYGFPGNHFWKIMFTLTEARPTEDYARKIAMLKEHRIALWDVIRSCTRQGASDSSIRCAVPNNILHLVRRYPNLTAIFLNGRASEKLYSRYFGGKIHIPVFYLPSTSPAHASLAFEKKLKAWRAIQKFLENRNPWC